MVGADARLFLNRSGVATAFAAAGHWSWRKHCVSLSRVRSALAGMGSLRLASVSADGASTWICLELVDEAKADRLFRVLDAVEKPRSLLLESSRRGFHLWVFVEPIPRTVARLGAAPGGGGRVGAGGGLSQERRPERRARP